MATRPRPAGQLRAHAPRDGRAVRRRLGRGRLVVERGRRPASRRASTSTTAASPPQGGRQGRARRRHASTASASRSSGRELVISGERPVQETEGRVYQQVEIEAGPFRRVVELGADVVAEEAPGHLRGRHPAGRAAAALAAGRARRVPIEPQAVELMAEPGGRRRPRSRSSRRPTSRRRSASARASRCPAALPVLPLKDMVAYPGHADPARGRPGALDAARQRRALRRADAGHGRLARPRARRARARPALRRRRRRHRRPDAQGPRRDDAHPRPGDRAGADRRLRRRGALPGGAHRAAAGRRSSPRRSSRR